MESKTVAPASGDFHTARLLLSRGATCDLTIAAALGNMDRVAAFLTRTPPVFAKSCEREPRIIRGSQIRPPRDRTSAAGSRRRSQLARIRRPQGASLHAAASTGDREMVELLLAHGADPNGHVDSAGNAVFAAKTPELRALLMARGGKLDPYDLVWLDEDDEVMRRVTEDPSSAELGCGGVFTAVCTRGKRELLLRLLRRHPRAAGCDRVPQLPARKHRDAPYPSRERDESRFTKLGAADLSA